MVLNGSSCRPTHEDKGCSDFRSYSNLVVSVLSNDLFYLLNATGNYSIPTQLLTQLVFSNLFFVFVLISGKEWLLDVHVSPLWLAVRVLGCGCMGALVWAVVGGSGSTNDMEVSTEFPFSL